LAPCGTDLKKKTSKEEVMATQETKQEILENLRNAVIEYDEEKAEKAAKVALEVGMDANDAIFNGIVNGMEEVGRLFEEQEYFVPEIFMCADALYKRYMPGPWSRQGRMLS
jgi:trimethylamine corrinoid protein